MFCNCMHRCIRTQTAITTNELLTKHLDFPPTKVEGSKGVFLPEGGQGGESQLSGEDTQTGLFVCTAAPC